MRAVIGVVVVLLVAACSGPAVHAVVLPPTPTSTSTTVDRPVPQAGCPPAPHAPIPTSPPWHPAALVPESALPPPQVPVPWHSDVRAISGKGMWVWQWPATEHGDVDAVVGKARAAGLHQLWVRVADSRYGFSGAPELNALVDKAHAAGIAVIAWGFPYLYDPVGDAGWTAQVLAWRSPTGGHVDGFSADLETASEGVAMSAVRAAVYLDRVRQVAGNRLVVATVFPPFDHNWSGGYPYEAMAPYVDAFAPMEYWECADPGADAIQALARLGALRPIHLIGQAFGLGDVGGRIPAPSAAEITRFLDVGRTLGAVGASFWDWQSADPAEWAALTKFSWR